MNNLKYILFTIILIGSIYAREFQKKEQFYLIFVNNTDNDTSLSSLNKRQESNVYTVVDEIHNLIVKNKKSYDHPEVLEAMEESNARLRKREDNVHYLMEYGESSYVYPISTTREKIVLYSYLSEDVAEAVEFLPNVLNCAPDSKKKKTSYYNTKKIKKETKWKDVKILKNADLHLSLLSQGKYDPELVNQYDTNYYHPKSAGKGIDIFMIDGNFNFKHPEFKNRNKRVAECAANVFHGRVTLPKSKDYCINDLVDFHGALISDAAGGMIHGVAKNANIYGINLVDDFSFANEYAALEYIRDRLLNPHKSIINLSVSNGYTFKQYREDPLISYENELISEITELGAIFVSSAGNDNAEVYNEEKNTIYLPCVYDDVICVGSIENCNIENVTETNYYLRASWSNYGKNVDVWAPGCGVFSYQDENSIIIDKEVDGTSYSSPIVSGVIATIMSENDTIDFTVDTMKEYLKSNGIPNVVSGILTEELTNEPPTEEETSIFINNGKRVVYSMDGIYYGCGHSAGDKKCPKNNCCLANGKCQLSSKDGCSIQEGCQREYGQCKIDNAISKGI